MKKEKLIVSNRAALEKKYGAKHTSILKDLKAIQAADKKRGLISEIIFLDDAAVMKKYKSAAVKTAGSAKQNKLAIDGLFKHFQPDYLMIAGAQDIVPFQPLENLLFGEDDEDQLIHSDLPYACETAYSTNPGKFVSPTRVVGRLPDVPGGKDPAYFHSLVADITGNKPGKQQDYRKYFSISVHDWRLSTQESLHNIFGDNASLQLSPLLGPEWTSTQLKAKTHFINCHGALDDPSYYGQKGKKFPEALRSSLLSRKISKGSIVAAECCYGAQLYDPAKTETAHLSIASNYLLNHAIAFAGSSTIAYGPAKGQGLADLLTQYFLINTIKGASTGRAFLEARQRFLDEMGPALDPYELKTIAQFYLLGDPSLVAVAMPARAMEDQRRNRRDGMMAKGVALSAFISVPKPLKEKKEDTAVSAFLKRRKMPQKLNKKVFINETKSSPLTRGMKSFTAPVKFHVYSASTVHGKFKSTNVLVVKERNGEILGHREYVRR
ncbi:hypothetical protein [Chitinophaga barathri]|uniref:Gingipain domain-containing protein n=1 Tax=Chitinophaga barathri TaxID=1647451 RepID=A0A3N4MJZ0_9BACT|nr:hypothetical protein [Chitinophaga barathri]RPD42217.1 hypothetical protein EG028_03285 [Chitinophaga barathri]